MTTYAAYDRGLPCRNTSCASHGKSHPNCRCYPTLMAEGGEVERKCSGPHIDGCEYYLENPPTDEDGFAAASANLGAHGIFSHQDVNKHTKAIERGHSAIDSAMSSVFSGEGGEVPADLISRRDKVHQYLERGGVTQELKDALYQQNEAPQAFAEGGSVQHRKKASPSILDDQSIAAHYPTHNVMLNVAKGRIATYLNGLRPGTQSIKAPFDDDEDTTDKQRKYHRAIDVANHPLGVLGEINRGTIEPEQVAHLGQMYPELMTRLQKGLTENIIKAQLKKERPTYKVRQGLSLFMGAALSSELKPQMIQAAQATFVGKPQPQDQGQPSPKEKGSKSSLSKSDEAYLTGDQAVMKRAQAQRG